MDTIDELEQKLSEPLPNHEPAYSKALTERVEMIRQLRALKEARLIEALAAYAHDAWSGWMTYQFSKGIVHPDGSVTIPKWANDRWERQCRTPYADLPETEKESDRAEALKMLEIVGRLKP